MAAGVLLDGGGEVGAAELRPQRGCDDELGVRNLPQEEIADAHLSAGPDQEVRVGPVPGVEMLGEYPLRDLGGVELPGLDLFRHRPGGLDDFSPAAVAEREDAGQAVVSCQESLGLPELVLDGLRQPPDLSDDLQQIGRAHV